MRMTVQRQVLLDVLRERSDHPRVAEIYRSAKERLPKISLGTVYRNLRAMAKDGHIRELSDDATFRYDHDTSPHLHIRCLECGVMEDIAGESSDTIPEAIESDAGDITAVTNSPDMDRGAEPEFDGWKLVGVIQEYIGYCPKCAKERSDESG